MRFLMKAIGEIVTGTQNGTQLLLKGLGYHSKDTFRLAQKMTIKMTTSCSTLMITLQV